VNNGGSETVFGTVSDTTVSGGGSQGVYSEGTASFTTVDSGGYEVVSNLGTAVSTTVNSGGFELVSSGFSIVSFTSVVLGGAIDVANLPYAPGGSASVNSTNDMLTVSVGGGSYTQQLAGDYTDVRFLLGTDAGSGTLVTAITRCFRSGTRILTDRGEIAVEFLRIGDRVPTVLGETAAPIIWIGRREVDCARHPKPGQVWPVRVAAGAFGHGRPGKELFLSPDHAVYVNDVLIPIKHLISGGSIVQVPVGRVTYYHLELPRHDVLLAEGLPTESFLDLRDGTNYADRLGPTRLYPDFSARMWEAFGCARLIVTGPELAAARALVAVHAAQQEAA
jgi:autotransporter passenger strand-loop-strand repeat protein